MEAREVGMRVGSLSVPRSKKSAAPANCSIRSCATAIATVVLPTPPLPTIVTKRVDLSWVETALVSSDLPTILIKRAGRFMCRIGSPTAACTLLGLVDRLIGATKVYPRPLTVTTYRVPPFPSPSARY
jgi:hypothetical protein